MWMDNWVLNTPYPLWPTSPHGCAHQKTLYRFFPVQNPVVVLANTNDPKTEVNTDRCQMHNIPILRRKGGGGTVVLTPGCVVLTFAFYAKELFANPYYFAKINGLWIKALEDLGISGFTQRGISDVALKDKKVVGTSLFRRKHLLVYQGSLLVNPPLEFIALLLKHPTKEPDYRQKRTHCDFMTSLQKEGFTHSSENIARQCQEFFRKNVSLWLYDDFYDKILS